MSPAGPPPPAPAPQPVFAGRHYLDHASTSPMRPEAVAAMTAWLAAPLADPGRIHAEGMAARHALEEARAEVAELFGARPREVVLTSGATEAIAAACFGAAERGAHQVVASVEHSAVRRSAEANGEVSVVGVDGLGRVDVDELLAAVRPDTALVHLQWANHEVGTTQPVAQAVGRCRERGVLVHVDAAQAAGRVPIAFDDLGADLCSVSGHKLGGPPGAGALLVRRGLRVRPLLVGGDQERARRAGLENLPAVAGFGAACAALAADGGARLATEAQHARRRTDRIADYVTDGPVGGLRLHGDPVGRLPHLICVAVDDVEPQAVVLALDRAGVAVHSGSSCASEGIEPSPVLAAMGVDAERSLRASVGWSSTDADVDALLDALGPVLAALRSLRR